VHAYGLADDIQPAARNDLFIGTCWIAVPRSHEAGSFYFNSKTWTDCGIEFPPPFNDVDYPAALPYSRTYTHQKWRDQMVKLAQCGVQKPLITQECMITRVFAAVLQSADPPIPMLDEAGRTSAWRGPQFVNVTMDIFVPILRAVWRIDPLQTMVQEWINWMGPSMQLYAPTPLAEWKAERPVGLDRSECQLATSVNGNRYTCTRVHAVYVVVVLWHRVKYPHRHQEARDSVGDVSWQCDVVAKLGLGEERSATVTRA